MEVDKISHKSKNNKVLPGTDNIKVNIIFKGKFMVECTDTNCFTNDPDSPFMCDDCLNDLLVNKMTMDEVYEMYAIVKELLADDGTFEALAKLFAASEGEDMTEMQLREELQGSKHTMFSIFNNIMKDKLEEEDD